MLLQSFINAGLVIVLLLNFSLLAASRLATSIFFFAIQCFVLALMPFAAYAQGSGSLLHCCVIFLGTLSIKVVLIPKVLLWTIRSSEIHREIEPVIGFTTSLIIGAVLAIGSFAVRGRLPLPAGAISDLLVPVSLTTLLIGLLIIVSRVKAITQVLGYLVMENGIFVLGLLLLRAMPVLVELGILLDVFVGVFVMAIVVYHIRREFDHIDTQRLDQLRETQR